MLTTRASRCAESTGQRLSFPRITYSKYLSYHTLWTLPGALFRALMGQVIQFAPATLASPQAPFKHPPIRLSAIEVAWSIREKLEYVAEVFAEHEDKPAPGFTGSCGCRMCDQYRHIWLNPAVQRILGELFA
jgi:hypothetical protein